MKLQPHTRFSARDGAMLDLTALDELSVTPARWLDAWLAVRAPKLQGIVLEGLELDAPLDGYGLDGQDPGRAVLTPEAARSTSTTLSCAAEACAISSSTGCVITC